MKKIEVDMIINFHYTELKAKSKSIMLKATLPIDEDVIGYAYEKTVQEADKIKDKKQVKSYFLQHIKYASTKTGSEYQRKTNKRRETADISNVSYSHEFTINDCKSILDQFIEQKCDNTEKLLATLMVQGYNTSTRLSEYTTIPRSTCHLLLSNIKKKLSKYIDENNLKNELKELIQ